LLSNQNYSRSQTHKKTQTLSQGNQCERPEARTVDGARTDHLGSNTKQITLNFNCKCQKLI